MNVDFGRMKACVSSFTDPKKVCIRESNVSNRFYLDGEEKLLDHLSSGNG